MKLKKPEKNISKSTEAKHNKIKARNQNLLTLFTTIQDSQTLKGKDLQREKFLKTID